MNKKNKKIIFKIRIMIIFILLLITPIAIGYIEKTNIILVNKKYFYENYNIYDFPEYVAKEKFPDFYYKKDNFNSKNQDIVFSDNNYITTFNEILTEKPIQSLLGPTNSPWPMQSHDIRHTGRSPFSTINTWEEIWRVNTLGWAYSSPVIDEDGTIYIGASEIYAIYSNGTLKWKYDIPFRIESAPAIDENGVIYVGNIHSTIQNYLYAIYINNGTLKWSYETDSIFSSPVIGDDGTIYFGYGGGPPSGYINALYPNGTLRWRFQTNHAVYSSPAIGLDGTIYCGSHDGNVYALYPNNGTLKWKYNTGSWVHGSPTIADDGTVYIGSDNGYLYAFYPDNGTVKWCINVGSMHASPTLDDDGTLYFGVWEKTFYAVYPNGTIKWSFNTGNGKVWGSSAALSDDGTLYFGTCDLEWSGGVEIIALYIDGTVKWRKSLDTVFSSPAIGSDGTVYIGANQGFDGYLVAFGIVPLKANAHGPYYGLINQSIQFKGSAIGGYSPFTSWHWSFGDNTYSDEQNPIHIYTEIGNYTVTLTVTDNTSNTSSDNTFAWIQETNSPPNKPNIDGPTRGVSNEYYEYTFNTVDPDGNQIWYFVDWDDNMYTGWLGPFSSGTIITVGHTWYAHATFTIKCKAKDVYGDESEWGEFNVEIPRNNIAITSLFLRFLERFPLLQKLLSFLSIYN